MSEHNNVNTVWTWYWLQGFKLRTCVICKLWPCRLWVRQNLVNKNFFSIHECKFELNSQQSVVWMEMYWIDFQRNSTQVVISWFAINNISKSCWNQSNFTVWFHWKLFMAALHSENDPQDFSCPNSARTTILSSLWEFLFPVSLMDIPWGDFRSPWGVLKINGETPLVFIKRRNRYLISMFSEEAGAFLLQIGSALQWNSPHHYIFHFEPLFPFNFNWLHIKTPHSRSAFTCRLFCWNICRKICKEVFSLVWAVNPSGFLNKWDDWYLQCVAGSVFPFLTVYSTHHKLIDVYIQLLTHLRLRFGLQ